MDKPEALRLAALWEKQSHGYALTPEAKTAAELRRLHALNAELLEALKRIDATMQEIARAVEAYERSGVHLPVQGGRA